MVSGMATTKVTITLEDEKLEAVRRLVSAGKASSISGFIQHAVDIALSDVAGWQRLLSEALDRTGGSPTSREIAWADRILEGPVKKGRRRPPRRAA